MAKATIIGHCLITVNLESERKNIKKYQYKYLTSKAYLSEIKTKIKYTLKNTQSNCTKNSAEKLKGKNR